MTFSGPPAFDDLVAMIASRLDHPARRSRFVAEVAHDTKSWAERYTPTGRGSLDTGTYASAACWVYPGALPARLPLLAQWIVWFFWMDDRLSEGSGTTATVTGERLIFERRGFSSAGGEGPGEMGERALTDAFDDLLSRTVALTRATWSDRFLRQVAVCLGAFERERTHRLDGAPPLLEDYVELRRDASGMSFFQSLIDFSLGTELHADVHASADFREVLACAADIAGWTNDIFSYQKEVDAGEVDNVLVVLRHGRDGLSEAAALGTVLDSIAGRADSLRNAEHRIVKAPAAHGVRPGREGDVRDVLTGIKDMVAGNLAWIAESPRYRPGPNADTPPADRPSRAPRPKNTPEERS